MKFPDKYQKNIDNFYKEKVKHKVSDRCSIGHYKDCKFLQYSDGKEICKRGWCLCKV